MKKTLGLGIVVFLLLVGGGIFWVSHGEAHPLSAIQEDLYTYFPLIFRKYVAGPGDLYGYVFDASTIVDEETQKRQPVSGVEVCIDGLDNCVSTDTEGNYSFTNLSSGGHTLTLMHDEYYVRTLTVFVQDLKRTEWNIGIVSKLALAGGDLFMRISVDWNNTSYWYGSGCTLHEEGCPSDLDAHIWAVLTHTWAHKYQGVFAEDDCQVGDAVCVESFSENGPGPEVAAIVKISDPNSTFYFGVHHYYATRTGVPNIFNTGAVVRIFKKTGDYEEIQISQATGSGNFWYVFSMNAQGEITYQNCIIQKPLDPEPNPDDPPPPNLPDCPAK